MEVIQLSVEKNEILTFENINNTYERERCDLITKRIGILNSYDKKFRENKLTEEDFQKLINKKIEIMDELFKTYCKKMGALLKIIRETRILEEELKPIKPFIKPSIDIKNIKRKR